MKLSFMHKLKSMLVVSGAATAMYAALSIHNENEKFYDNVIMPLVHALPPETSHLIAVTATKYGLAKSKFQDPELLRTSVWNMKFSNPVGIAAGFDKQGEVVEGLHNVGFGFVEVGSVTPLPQPGNPKPRIFRLEKDNAIINRYGFNSDGHDAVYERLKLLRGNKDFTGIIGINLGKNKESEDTVNDYVSGIKKFGDVADYLVINISSPNTPGLRAWQKKKQLQGLLAKLIETRNELNVQHRPPLLLKLSPDLNNEERKDIAVVLRDKKCRVDGLVISNTTVERRGDLISENVQEVGGLSGQPLAEPSTCLIAEMYKLTNGEIPIIGVGGVFSGQDAYDKIRAGASLVQLYTSYIYHGPPRVTRIKSELEQLLRSNGCRSIAEAVGKGHTCHD